MLSSREVLMRIEAERGKSVAERGGRTGDIIHVRAKDCVRGRREPGRRIARFINSGPTTIGENLHLWNVVDGEVTCAKCLLLSLGEFPSLPF